MMQVARARGQAEGDRLRTCWWICRMMLHIMSWGGTQGAGGESTAGGAGGCAYGHRSAAQPATAPPTQNAASATQQAALPGRLSRHNKERARRYARAEGVQPIPTCVVVGDVSPAMPCCLTLPSHVGRRLVQHGGDDSIDAHLRRRS